MELKEMSISELEERKNAIVGELDAPEADLDALEAEMKSINEELESRRAEEAKKTEIRDMVAAGAGTVIETPIEAEERKTMTNEEVRNSAEYIDAYVKYIKTNDPTECRTLTTTNVEGTIPVPMIVEQIVKTAWEEDDILNRVRKSYIRGNVGIGFEISGDDAVIHEEGTAAPSEEELTHGVCTLIPQNIKKWITITDEVMAMGGEAFLDYIYRELTYRISKKLADSIVDRLMDLTTTASGSQVSIAQVTAAPDVVGFADAFAHLSDEARNPVIIMNKLTYADAIAAQAAGNFAMDPFRGMPVLFNNELPAYSSAGAADIYCLVGDLGAVQVNYPEGEGIVLKFDDLTLAEADLIKIVGRQYVGFDLTACGRFTQMLKPSSGT